MLRKQSGALAAAQLNFVIALELNWDISSLTNRRKTTILAGVRAKNVRNTMGLRKPDFRNFLVELVLEARPIFIHHNDLSGLAVVVLLLGL